jgi:predicted RNA binding protein YcfA (HicA-like mRNA interferase family)
VELNRDRIRRRLEHEGWQLDRRGANHDIYWHPDFKHVIPLPRHRTVSPGVGREIAKKAEWE